MPSTRFSLPLLFVWMMTAIAPPAFADEAVDLFENVIEACVAFLESEDPLEVDADWLLFEERSATHPSKPLFRQDRSFAHEKFGINLTFEEQRSTQDGSVHSRRCGVSDLKLYAVRKTLSNYPGPVRISRDVVGQAAGRVQSELLSAAVWVDMKRHRRQDRKERAAHCRDTILC